MEKEEESLLKQAKLADEIIIYGAHLVALECCRWLIANRMGNKISGFAVTNINANPRNILNYSVKKIDEYENQKALIFIAMPNKYHDEVEAYVKSKNFFNIIKIGLEDMSKLKWMQWKEGQKNHPYFPFVLEEDKNDPSWLNLYMKLISVDIPNDSSWEQCICKFPTLFYLDDQEVFKIIEKLDFNKECKNVCGQFQNLHILPVGKRKKAAKAELRQIIKIYMAFSIWDNIKINNDQYAAWVCPLQVGSSLSEVKYGNIFDDEGDNISIENPLFSEMTGAYWIWKHVSDSKYKGLCHYRRHFIISEEEIMELEKNHVDVILPTPRFVPGGLKEMFLAETPVNDKIFDNTFCVLSELYSNEREKFESYLKSCFYYPNNMVIAKREIYDDYCSWLFPVLFRMQEISAEKNYEYKNDRHIAYAAELLTSYYFIEHKDQYHIAVTDYKYFS